MKCEVWYLSLAQKYVPGKAKIYLRKYEATNGYLSKIAPRFSKVGI